MERSAQPVPPPLDGDRYTPEPDGYLGSGAFGRVWKYADRRLGGPVAVKLLRHDYSKTTADIRLEAKRLRALSHRNIVRVLDLIVLEGTNDFALVMEYVDGRRLSRVIADDCPCPVTT